MDQYRVVPMRLFATWEIDRTSPNCVPRLAPSCFTFHIFSVCTMVMTRLTVLKQLDTDTSHLVIAVKLSGYKRILRSNDVVVNAVNGIIDVDLSISFTLQYPHFVKRKANCVHVLLQRRRRVKNRPIPGGFKTIAVGVINLTDVLQSNVDRELTLYAEVEKSGIGDEDKSTTTTVNSGSLLSQQQCQTPSSSQAPIAKLYFHAVGTQPLLEADDPSQTRRRQRVAVVKRGHGEAAVDLSDDDNEDDSTNEDVASDSDQQVALDDSLQQSGSRGEALRRNLKGGIKHLMPPARFTGPSMKQRNLKQKFVTLLKKFKINEETLATVEGSVAGSKATSRELEKLFEELDNLSDSGGELDNVSQSTIHSEPKPRLPTYFNSATNSHEKLPMETLEDIFDRLESAAIVSDGTNESVDENEESDTKCKSARANGVRSTKLTAAEEKRQLQQHRNSNEPQIDTKEKLKIHISAPASVNKQDKSFAQISSAPLTAGSSPRNIPSDKEMINKVTPNNTPPHSAISHSTSHSILLANKGKPPLIHQSSGGLIVPSSLQSDINALKHQSVVDQVNLVYENISATTNYPCERLCLCSARDIHCQGVVDKLSSDLFAKHVIVATSANDVRQFMLSIVNRVQKFCNTNAQTPRCTQLCVIGGDRFFAYFLRSYTELLGNKSADWLTYLRFVLIAPSGSMIARIQKVYDNPTNGNRNAHHFVDVLWRDWWEKVEMPISDINEVVSRISRHVNNANTLTTVPIAEAMLQLRQGVSEENSQIFVPFVVDVRFGADIMLTCHDVTLDSPSTSTSAINTSSLTPLTMQQASHTSPCVSPRPHNVSTHPLFTQLSAGSIIIDSDALPPSPPLSSPQICSTPTKEETQELHIEYWTQGLNAATQEKNSLSTTAIATQRIDVTNNSRGFSTPNVTQQTPIKYSLKTSFRSLVIQRLLSHQISDIAANTSLSIHFVKEKKKEKMFQKLGMRPKTSAGQDGDSGKWQHIASVSRLICSAPSKHAAIKLCVDGVEYNNVKFFQISPQWQTHVKAFPLMITNNT